MTTANTEPQPPASMSSVADEAPLPLGPVLRIVGGTSIVAAMATFLVQRWDGVDDAWMYLVLLGVTLVLGVSALVSGLRFADAKGARALLGVVLSTVPIHFAIVGGLLVSQFGAPASGAPDVVRWVASSPWMALAAAGAALAGLVPLIWATLRVFVRSSATQLAVLYVGLNLLLWLPWRTAEVVSLLIVSATALWFWADTQVFGLRAEMCTLEGRWVRALLLVPVALLGLRQVVIYGVPFLLLWALFEVVAAFLVYAGSRMQRSQGGALEIVALFPHVAGVLALLAALEDHLGALTDVHVALAALLQGGVLCGLSLFARHFQNVLTGAASILAVLVTALAFSLGPSLAVSLSLAIGSTAILAFGLRDKRPTLLLAGGLGVVLSLLVHLVLTLEDPSLLGWGGLVAYGFGVMGVATIVERAGLARFPRKPRRNRSPAPDGNPAPVG